MSFEFCKCVANLNNSSHDFNNVIGNTQLRMRHTNCVFIGTKIITRMQMASCIICAQYIAFKFAWDCKIIARSYLQWMTCCREAIYIGAAKTQILLGDANRIPTRRIYCLLQYLHVTFSFYVLFIVMRNVLEITLNIFLSVVKTK